MQIGKSVHHNFAAYARTLNPYLSNHIWGHINNDIWNLVIPVWDSVNDAIQFNFEELGVWS